jgi:diguanylate cyclase (GGDEF)-like protein
MRQVRIPIATRILAVSGVSLGIFAMSMLRVVRRTVTRAVYSETSAGVAVAQNVFWHLLESKGSPSIVDGALYVGRSKINGDHSLVDHLKHLTGADATLFALVGGKPIRVSTTVSKLDGSGRNIGTELLGPAREAFDRGERFEGTGLVAGRDFINRYDALRDAGGKLVGAVYTGVPLTRMHEAAEETMRVIMVGTAIALLPSLVALYLITRPVNRTFMRVVAIARGLALGNVDQSTYPSFLNDELGDVNRAFSEMMAYLQHMTIIADAIAQGDLSSEIVPASSADRLGNAFVRMTINLRELVAELQASALTDNLTQLGNRRAFDHHLDAEISRTARHGGTLSLALIDVDEFKAVNDTHGHQRGDEVLAKLGEILKSARLEDAGYRLGGDEFAFVLPDTSALEASTIMERIRVSAQAQLGATVSIGIASSVQGLLDAQTLHHRADAALYHGKERGRNAIVSFDGKMLHPARLPPSIQERAVGSKRTH